jgi:long-chain acyl-CoA synthetase
LVIIDRVKNIFKLAQGEYIAPEKYTLFLKYRIENVYIKHELVAQAYVHGDSLQSYLVAVIVPDVELFMPWATKHNFTGTFQEIITKPEVTKAVLNELTEFGRANDLKGFEIARTIYMDSELFSVQNGLLTPSFKLKVIK